MKKSKKNTVGIMDRILVFIAILLLIFTSAMIVIYVKTGGIPDTLCTCVFSVCGGECGVMGWIKTNKDRQRDREYELEDKKNEERQSAGEEV
jgi:predicted aminopeptidase